MSPKGCGFISNLPTSAHAIDDDHIAILGGFNKGLFDRHMRNLTATDQKAHPDKRNRLVTGFMSLPPEDYRWNPDMLVYDISTNSWSNLGHCPSLPNCGAALAARATDLVLISGEVKPGLRTAEVKRIVFGADGATWSDLAPLPPRPGEMLQEGMAGAYAGYSNGVLLLAGGACFPGARARAEVGRWYAHEGLTKVWNTEVYALVGRTWKIAGALPTGLAYGARFQLPAGVLIVGGEDAERRARGDVFLMRWDGTKVIVSDRI